MISARKGSVQAQIYLADRVFAVKDAGKDPYEQARQIRDALRAMEAVEHDGQWEAEGDDQKQTHAIAKN